MSSEPGAVPGPAEAGPAALQIRRRGDGAAVVDLSGDWRSRPGLPGTGDLEAALGGGPPPPGIEFDTARIGSWDSGLLVFLASCEDLCRARGWRFGEESLPAGVRRLLQLVRAVPEKTDARPAADRPSFLRRVGEGTLAGWAEGREALSFLGEVALAFGRLLRGRARFRGSDAALVLEVTGPGALGIAALINLIVGMIIAFVGAVQLLRFGAAVYVADLVAVAALREMGCLMTGIIVCGRTGAAFAAQLGTMKVNEEIDAFRTFGISPVEFLALPRILALALMMPLLCVWADFFAIAGGFLVSSALLNVSAVEYMSRTTAAVSLTDFFMGIAKGAVFGVLVGFWGCLKGLRCGSNAAAVGEAATSAVVRGITAIIVADGLFAVLCNALGI